MGFAFSWFGSYLKAAWAAAFVLAMGAVVSNLWHGVPITFAGAAILAGVIFVGVAVAAILPALALSAAPELIGIGPSRFIYTVLGAGLALGAVAGVTLQDINEADLIHADQTQILAWAGETFRGYPRGDLLLVAFAGASAGGALAGSRRRARNRAVR